MEVVSDGAEARRRDFQDKRLDYAKARIPEYWIVDPDEKLVLVLVLKGDAYQLHGKFGVGEQARGVLLDGLQVDVAKLMKLGEKK